MQLGAIRDRLRTLGAGPRHERVLLRAWTRALPLAQVARDPEHSLPLAVRRDWPRLSQQLADLARVRSQHISRDGASRLLVELVDGVTVEAVLLPRDGLCVSTQAGCAVGCAFCMTGRDGLRRQLGSAEIVAQVALGRSLAKVRKVVFMGMGEPAHNLDAVLEAIDLLGTEGDVAHKNLVLSTVGDRRVFERLRDARVKPALALSLHTMSAGKRASLLPRAPRLDPAELVDLGERYARSTRYPIQYQWTLLESVNDGDDEIEAIGRTLAGKYAVLNLIPYNAVDGLAFRRPAPERLLTISRELNARGILTKLRDSAGQDVDGGCGQLRSRSLR